MKIISGWRDYYDHVAHIYGGGDPKVIYNRDYVIPDEIHPGGMQCEASLTVKRHESFAIPHKMEIVHAGIHEVQMHEFRALVVMGRVFFLERHGDETELGELVNVRKDWHISTRPILNEQYGGPYALMKEGEAFTSSARIYEKRRMQELLCDPTTYRRKYKQGSKSDIARKLCEFAGAPVFLLSGNDMPTIYGRTPRLSALGLPAYIDPQQLYQELAMFVGNVLKPVEQPPSTMKDIEKVTSHGFDKKASFRHRK
jgi:hypothetical protein